MISLLICATRCKKTDRAHHGFTQIEKSWAPAGRPTPRSISGTLSARDCSTEPLWRLGLSVTIAGARVANRPLQMSGADDALFPARLVAGSLGRDV
jgi:hypothetical protein